MIISPKMSLSKSAKAIKAAEAAAERMARKALDKPKPRTESQAEKEVIRQRLKKARHDQEDAEINNAAFA